jgi:His-Xaa-Ser system radical SAM maturase HxsB
MAAEASRLTAPTGTLERSARRVAAHGARGRNGSVLITNEAGAWQILPQADYARYVSGAISDDEPVGGELGAKDFLRDRLNFPRMADALATRHLLRWPGPSVHTMVVTRRCNLKCAYCHASVIAADDVSTDMTVQTAKGAVDLAFESGNPEMTIEFQGGEPLLNWPVVKFIVEYARLKNKTAAKRLHLGLISNFSLLDEAKADWLIERGVSFCTSLDGPADLHDRQRVYLGGNGHASVVAGLKMLVAKKKAGAAVDAPNAICTVTRNSLGRAREIVDQVVALGLERVQLGPLDPIGFARRSWDTIGCTTEEFLAFYAEALDYLIALNEKGVKAYEKMSLVLLIRILENGQWRFPNADGVARLAYDWDGSVYTGEDGRLLAAEGDDFFRIGRVGESRLTDLLDHPTLKTSLYAALPATQPQCFQCAYAPYCTVQPVYNRETQGGPWGQMPTNGWCAKMLGIFDILFDRLQNPRTRKVLESWLDYRDR